MSINHDSKLLFPFIVKDKEDNYHLVSVISKEGIVIDRKVIVFDTFENDYSKELMLLEKAEYITNERKDIQFLIKKIKIVFPFYYFLYFQFSPY